MPKSYQTVQSHVRKCPQELASAFTYVLAVACGSQPPAGVYASEYEFEDYAWTHARVLPLRRHISENVVWLWVYTLMTINSNADISRLGGTVKHLSKRTVLKLAIDLGQYLLAAVEQDEIEEADDGLDSTQNIVRRTWTCIITLAQLHAIGTATEDPMGASASKIKVLPAECKTLLSKPAASIAGE